MSVQRDYGGTGVSYWVPVDLFEAKKMVVEA